MGSAPRALSFGPRLVGAAFSHAISFAWGLATAVSRFAAERGWRERVRLPAGRVISVGNLQAGGAGKTPLTARIAREAAERGKSACILTRGYGGAWERRGGVIAPRGAGAIVSPEDCGDEAALLAELAPAAWIAVGADRVAAHDRARKRHGRDFDLVLLDDGFQHVRLARDLEILAMTSATRSERIHRDFAGAATRADLIVWTKGDRAPDARDRPTVRVRYRPRPLPGTGGQVLADRPLWLVTGVGDGAAVRSAVEAEGYRVARHTEFRDHARYDRELAERLAASALDGGLTLAMTGKDWVKWRSFGVVPARLLAFEPELELVEGGERWSRTLWDT